MKILQRRNKTMRNLIVTFGILALVGILAVPVFAHGPYGGQSRWSGGPGYCWQDDPGDVELSQDQRNELSKLDQEFYNNTAELRRQIWNKSDELDVLLNTADPDPSKAKALQQEKSALKAKMAEQRIDYELKARKIAPESRFARGYGRGYGRHMRGQGPQGGGYGPGSCWN
jgi:zinc resistance-associated protein